MGKMQVKFSKTELYALGCLYEGSTVVANSFARRARLKHEKMRFETLRWPTYEKLVAAGYIEMKQSQDSFILWYGTITEAGRAALNS